MGAKKYTSFLKIHCVFVLTIATASNVKIHFYPTVFRQSPDICNEYRSTLYTVNELTVTFYVVN